jgi:hypothetical protein
MVLPIIYLFCHQVYKKDTGDRIGYAVAEDGHCLASHLSSSEKGYTYTTGSEKDGTLCRVTVERIKIEAQQ